MTQIEGYHWALWARSCIDLKRYAHTGYRSETEFYTPPKWGKMDSDGSTLAHPPTPEDEMIAAQIGKGVVALRQVDGEAAGHLVEWFGAYLGAPDRRGHRVSRMGIAPNRAAEIIKRHQAWVEGWVSRFREEHRISA